MIKRALLPGAAAVLLLCACSGGGPSSVPPAVRTPADLNHNASSSKIKHVVIIVQENRSFNNLFYDFPGAKTVKYGHDTKGRKITLRPVGLETTWDIVHDFYEYLAACNGTGSYPGTDCRMNGFNNEYSGCGHNSSQPPCPNADPPYSYVPQSETKPYFYLGEHYVLADQMYASNVDASSFISHQYIIAGQASSAVNYPSAWWGCEGTYSNYIATLNSGRQYGSNIPMCWTNKTVGDEMDHAGLSWAYYASKVYGDGGLWSAYQNISQIYNGPDWKKNVISPQTDFFGDVSRGRLRDLSWITPTCENSDHAGCGSKTGPAWVASLVNAIGKSKYWDSTAIFIFWDDYGGWYDPEPPAKVDYDGLGIRIPMLIVSAYAKAGYVSHTHYEHGSILKFVETTFGLASLSASDKRATAPDDAFDFNKPPRAFETIPAEHGIDYFMHQLPDYRLPDND
ncbi:MAG: alkaline phosphatase family protein [Candidatus Cybelea sp.]